MSESLNVRNILADNKDDRQLFSLESDVVTITNPLDQSPLIFNNIQCKSQFLHEIINKSGDKITVSLMFRVVKSTCINSLSDDKIVTDGTNGHIDVANSYLGFDIYIYAFHSKLSILYHNTVY